MVIKESEYMSKERDCLRQKAQEIMNKYNVEYIKYGGIKFNRLLNEKEIKIISEYLWMMTNNER